jgi:hypothetical protein
MVNAVIKMLPNVVTTKLLEIFSYNAVVIGQLSEWILDKNSSAENYLSRVFNRNSVPY